MNDHISLNSKGYIDFKGILKDELNKSNITQEDALLILLDVIYSIAENRLTDYELIPFFFKKRIRSVKEFNKESDKTQIDLKIKKFFNKNYDYEKDRIETHVSKLESKNNINLDIRKSNKNFIYNIKFDEFDINEEPTEKKTHKIKRKKIIKKTKVKINLDHLNKEDLCFILGLNPELTFEKAKILRTRIIEEISKLQIDGNDLKNATPNDLKRYLAPIREKEQKKKIQKEKFKNIISKVNSFNNKSFSYILSSKDEYLEIYDEINNNFPDVENKDLKYFKSFHDYVNHIEEYKLIIERVFSQKELIDKLNAQIFDSYLNFEKRNDLKSYYNEVFAVYNKINILPEVLKNKFLDENNDFKYIIDLFSDFKEYTTISESSEDNKIRKHNEQYLDKIINQNKEFFKDITDINKKRAIVLDEKNVKVIAGAGTGKTYTIQKKVKYLIEKLGVDPEKILCLCYTYKGALELRKKVNEDINVEVNAVTFHEFCRRVDKACGGKRHTNKYLLDYIIRKYIHDLSSEDKLNKLMEYFCYYVDINPKNYSDSFFEKIMILSGGYTTLKGKYYKLNESVYYPAELLIANYLFIHGIDYEYEKYYESDYANLLLRFSCSGIYLSLNNISEEKSNFNIIKEFFEKVNSWKSYYSDFYLPKYRLYIDYITSKAVSNETKEQIKDKILYHKLHNSKQIKINEDNFKNGNLLDKLNNLLIENNVEIGLINQKEILEYFLVCNDDYKDFTKLVRTFINIFESKNMNINDFNSFKERNKLEKDNFSRKRQELLLDIILEIYKIYSEYKKSNTFDHNHEISNALDLIESGQYTPSLDYILIDEYQDINQVRCKLIQELQKKTNCKIFVVGDDWQSIYRFSGSDVNLFIDFDDFFAHSETIKLEENRRNTQKLIDISSSFIKKNKNQIFKNLTSFIKERHPNLNPIKIVTNEDYIIYGKKENRILKLDAIIRDIVKNNHKDDLKILILGRNNNDINYLINNALFKEKREKNYRKILYSKQKNLDITFMTIHQAKGLEYDEVIIINFEGNPNYGFPNDIKDDSLLKFVKVYESYPYAEERRLLYVALTRSLHNVYLLTPESDESTFINELRNDFGLEDINLPIDKDIADSLFDDSDFFNKFEYYETDIPCPKCNGKLTVVVNNFKGTKYVRCSNHRGPSPYHYDGGPIPKNYRKEDVKYIEKCPSCKGVLIRYRDVLKCCLYYKGCMETKELKLDDEDLQYDE